MSSSMRPLSAPAGGAVAVCPHCWGVNVGGERLCGRCGADMALLLQESGGLRRTPAVQSPVPVRVAGRLGPLARAALLLFTALLALAWLVAPLLGSAGAGTRNRKTMARWRDSEMAGRGHSTVPAQRGLGAPDASFAPMQRMQRSPSRRPTLPLSRARRDALARLTRDGRV